MKVTLENVLPGDIEKRSFAIIEGELRSRGVILPEDRAPLVKRVIHTSADFEYADTLCFSDGVIEKALAAIGAGASVITDTKMGYSGINKRVLEKYGGQAYCFMGDADVAEMAKKNGTTRAVAAVDKAAVMEGPLIFAVGNAPTALIRLYELITEGKLSPALVVGAPVGFVNVVQSKELIMETGVPYVVARGRKGGSNVAAAICNALLYMLDETRGL